MNDIGCRVFRRNNKNIIILWDAALLAPEFVDSPTATVIEDGGREILLTYSKFRPDNPEKFSKHIAGIVVSHINNNLDPAAGYKIKLAFVNGQMHHEAFQDVLPVSAVSPESIKPAEIVHLYGYDYNNRKWVPMPIDPKLLPEQ